MAAARTLLATLRTQPAVASGSLRTAFPRAVHTGALRPTLMRADETYREIHDAQNTYHPRGFQNSAGYRRARQPYVVRNMVTLAGIGAFVLGVYFYSILMVEQDDFSDLDKLRVVSDHVDGTPSPDRLAEVDRSVSATPDPRVIAEAATGLKPKHPVSPVRPTEPVAAFDTVPATPVAARESSPAMNKRVI